MVSNTPVRSWVRVLSSFVLSASLGLGSVGCGDDDDDGGASSSSSGGSDGGSSSGGSDGGSSSGGSDGGSSSGGSDGGSSSSSSGGGESSLIEAATAAGNFETLLGAIERAGLTETLEGTGPFTVFAPTDAAFAALPEGILDTLSPEDLERLLRYHVADGVNRAADLRELSVLANLRGAGIQIVTAGSDQLILDGLVQITEADIPAANGVIHVVDAVLLPPSIGYPGTLDEVVAAYPILGDLAAAVDRAELGDTLGGTTVTLFAPTNFAFAAAGVDPTSVDAEVLAGTLRAHVLDQEVNGGILGRGSEFEAINGQTISVVNDAGVLTLNGEVTVTYLGFPAENGYLHVLDGILTPDVVEVVTVVDVLADDDAFDTLSSVIAGATAVDQALRGEGPFTVFAPDDAAFDRLPAGVLETLEAASVEGILEHHATPGRLGSGDLEDGVSIPTVSEDSISVSAAGEIFYLDEVAAVTAIDTPADNGIIHTIDGVLLPPGVDFPGTVVEALAAYPRFSSLVAAVTQAGPEAVFAGEATSWTVFAPTNEAFEAAGIDLGSVDGDVLVDLLRYHLVGEALDSAAVTAGDAVTSVDGFEIPVVSGEGGVTIAGANLLRADLNGSNGVIHIIDAVLEPPTVVDVAVAEGGFTTLVAALERTGLDETLAGAGPFTVFAPTDAAFALLPEGFLEGAADDLVERILTYHVVPGELDAAAVGAAGTLTTVETSDITVDASGDGVILDGVIHVTATNIPAANGVIHVIDAVMLPADLPFPGTSVDLLSARPTFSSLVGAVGTAGLVETLSGEGPFTIFAPTNAAFEALGDISGLSEVALSRVLLHHVVSGDLDAEALLFSLGLRSELGLSVEVTSGEGGATYGGAAITWTDLETDNGVVHVLDAVVVPPSVVDVATADGNFTALLGAIADAELVETLQGDGPFTIFAPTDTAFGLLPEGRLGELDEETLVDVLTYHVVPGLMTGEMVMGSSALPTVETGDITISAPAEGQTSFIYLNGRARITLTDIRGANGVIHVIDAVIFPPSLGGFPGTVVEAIGATPRLSVLGSLVGDAGLVDALSSDNEGAGFTVFAPSNAGFESTPALPDGLLAEVLKTHVLPSTALAEALTAGTTEETLSRIDLEIREGAVGFENANGPLLYTDIEASNGVIHIIGEAITPPDASARIAMDPELSILAGLLSDTGLVSVFTDGGPKSVLAPTNGAFEALPEGLVDSLDDETLSAILAYHVLAGAADSDAVSGSSILGTYSEAEIEVAVVGDAVRLNGATRVVDVDRSSLNGPVHVVDSVLIPQSFPAWPGTVADFLVAHPSFSALTLAAAEADLVEALDADDEEITVFAPTNEAFEALGEIGDAALVSALLYHVAPGLLTAGDIDEVESLTTLLGAELPVTVGEDTLLVGGVPVVFANIETSNGIVHIIDTVLTPPTVREVIADNPVLAGFSALFDGSGLADRLAAGGPHTVFAPTDAAFQIISAALQEFSDGERAVLLDYHAVPGVFTAAELLAAGPTMTPTLNGAMVQTQPYLDGLLVDGSVQVVISDLVAANGIVHIIDAVLIPEITTEPAPLTAAEFIASRPFFLNFQNLVAGLGAEDELALDEATLFVPTNAAVAALGEPELSEPYLIDTIRHHVANEVADSAFVVGADFLETAMRVPLPIRLVDETPVVGGVEAGLVFTDLRLSDGIIHVVDEVLVPPSISDIVARSPTHTALAGALSAMGIDEALADFGANTASFNLFAPIDSAFEALPEGTIDGLDPGILSSVLIAHVLTDVIGLSEIIDAGSQPSLEGEIAPIVVQQPPGFSNALVNGVAQIIGDPIAAVNGDVYVIDGVLLQGVLEAFPGDIADALAAYPFYGSLFEGAAAVGILDALRDPNDGDGQTFFAPSRVALAAAGIDTLTEGQLRSLLTYHLGFGAFEGDDFIEAGGPTTVQTRIPNGPLLVQSGEGGSVSVNGDANVIFPDLRTSNGVVHLIDGVLTPPTVDDLFELYVDTGSYADAAGEFGLRELLAGAGEFTVLAPNDAAFELADFEGVFGDLGDDAFEAAFTALFGAHIVTEDVDIEALVVDGVLQRSSLPTLAGVDVQLRLVEDTLFLNGGAGLVPESRQCSSNGCVYQTDSVMLPAELGPYAFTVSEYFVSQAGFASLVQGAGAFNLDAFWDETGVTMFAPLDPAFFAWSTANEGIGFTDFLSYIVGHVGDGAFDSAALAAGVDFASAAGLPLAVEAFESSFRVNGSAVGIYNDVQLANGVLHIVDPSIEFPDAFDVIAGRPELSTLATTLEARGLTALLRDLQVPVPEQDPVSFTIFAPTNDAFARLPEGLLEGLEPEVLDEILSYHVVDDLLSSEPVRQAGSLDTLAGAPVVPSVRGERVFLNGVTEIIEVDILGFRGMVHVIDSVLLPPSLGGFPGTLADAVAAYPIFDELNAGLGAAQLTGALANTDDIVGTLFAPINDAFARLPEGAVASLSQANLQSVLTYHVHDDLAEAVDVASGAALTTLAGEDLTASLGSDGGVYLDHVAEVIVTDIDTDNGILHVLDSVLFPPSIGFPSDAADFVDAYPRLSTLGGALASTGGRTLVSNTGNITLLAPTNDAFDLLPDGLIGDLSDSELTDLLTYHVLMSSRLASDFNDVEFVPTFEGKSIAVSEGDGGPVFDGRVQVVGADIPVSNGVVHLVDSVLTNQPTFPGTVVDFVRASPRFSTLLGALERVGLAEELDAPAGRTFFMPPNSAFENLGVDLATLSDAELTQILEYHLLNFTIDATDLATRDFLETVAGFEIVVGEDEGAVFLDGRVSLTSVDTQASGTSVHVTDEVLLPPSTPEALALRGFSTLLTVLDGSGVADLLVGETYTLFAPTNEAFARIREARLDFYLADPANSLGNTLLHHAYLGLADADAVIAGAVTETALDGNGYRVTVTPGGDVVINGLVTVTTTDIRTTDGLIHVIDTILLPDDETSFYNGAELLELSARTQTMATNLRDRDLLSRYEDITNSYTLFVPTDDVFASSGLDLTTFSGAELDRLLNFHGIPSALSTFSLSLTPMRASIEGSVLTYDDTDGMMIEQATIVAPDIEAQNGFLNLIDDVLIPPPSE